MDMVFMGGIALLWGVMVLLVRGFEKLESPKGGRPAAPAGRRAAAQPAGIGQCQPGLGLQHRHQLSSPTPTGRAMAARSTMSYLTQMLALAVQNFLSAATGIVVVIALIRGFARHSAKTVGNAWVDL
jgi:hypothetical protein